MSNKKRRNKDEASPQNIDSNSSTSLENQAGKTGRTAYLKANWWLIAVIAFLSIGALGAGLKYLDEDAKREIARRESNKGKINFVEEPSMVSKINPFLSASPPPPTPQLSKEYIYAGSKVLAVEDVNANAAPPADLAVWRPSTGQWWVMGGAGGSQPATQTWGTSGDVPVPGDYDGDGKTDFSIFRPGTNQWWVIRSSDTTYVTYNFGATGDKPAPADYDGDSKTDVATFRPTTGVWYIFQSSSSSMISPSLGTNGDKPAPADFDGDGKADIAVFRNSNYTFYSINSINAQTQTKNLGILGEPVCGDYDGDGKADISIWSPSNTTWYYWKSIDGTTIVQYTFGIATDSAVQNDYDGDGKVDMALYRPINSGANDVGKWSIRQSSRIGQSNEIRQETWGISGDIPVPSYYRR